MTTTTGSKDVGARGVVGSRHLIGVQTFDIARLTNHPVPLIPGTFVAISGVGPQGDSNGSGKTSFLAAISVLLADPQWRLTVNGGRSAAKLLFKPDAAGLDPAQRFTPTPHGYIVGVFAPSADAVFDAVTVWVRISTSSPFVEARWSQGLHVTDADTDAERHLQADSLWRGCSPRKPISARKMAEVLYGDVPRCLTYLDTQMRPRIPSLLSQQMTEMDPKTIGDSLIALAGLDNDLATEAEQRGKFLERERDLATAIEDDAAARVAEEADLAGVVARRTAREKIDQAVEFWRRYLACRLLRAHGEDLRLEESAVELRARHREAEVERNSLREQLKKLRAPNRLAELEKEKRRERDELRESLNLLRAERATVTARQAQLASERPGLRARARDWSGADIPTSRQTVEDRRGDLARSELEAEQTATAVQEAEEDLKKAEAGLSGRPGEVIQTLREHGIDAIGLLDIVEPTPETRDAWEARLWPWRDAVAVPEARRDEACEHLATRIPGAQIVGVPSDPQDRPLALRGQHAVTTFLTNLENLTVPHPNGIEYPELNTAVVSGFEPPLAGRDNRVRAAKERLAQLCGRLTAAQRKVVTHGNLLKLATVDYEASLAVARLAEIAAEEEELGDKLKDIDEQLGMHTKRQDSVEEAWENANLALSSLQGRIEVMESHLLAANKLVDDRAADVENLQKERAKLAVTEWLRLWGDGLDHASLVVASEPEGLKYRAEGLKRRSSELLKEALSALGFDDDRREDASPDLKEAADLRERFSDDNDVKGPTIIFDDVSSLILARLAQTADNDLVTSARITEQCQKRERILHELKMEADKSAGVLTNLQDMLERHIESVFNSISDAYNRLDTQRGGDGALLEVTTDRPEGPGEWGWQATPRWRRSCTGQPVSYRETANGAQVKVQAIQLVLAAMLADADPSTRVLILDELGNSLGEINRRDTLTALQTVAKDQQVTILGTCQDSVLTDAADFCGQLLWFEHTTTSEPYNQPTRAWGFDENSGRVALTADWIKHGRPSL